MFRSEFLNLLSTLVEMSDDSDVEAMLEAPFKEGAEVGHKDVSWQTAILV